VSRIKSMRLRPRNSPGKSSSVRCIISSFGMMTRPLINVILGPERHAVALHFDEARVQDDEAGDALIITENPDEGVAVHQ
jgi:hypothetical protein